MRKKQPERTSLPTKPLTARSLVGMTMGARKRAAKSEGVRIGCKAGPKICDKLRKRMWRVWAQAPYARTARTEELAKIWQDMYAKYRIGKRLRPCPGCSVCARPCHYCEMQEPDDSRCPRCRQVMYSKPICDGSGVLPARKSK